MQFHFHYLPECGPIQPPREHELDEVLFCLSGKTVLNVDGQEWALSSSSVACIPAGLPHSDQPFGPRGCGAMLFSRETGLSLDGFCILHDHDSSFQTLFRMALTPASGTGLEQAYAAALGKALLLKLQCVGAIRPVWDFMQQDIFSAVRMIREKIRHSFRDPNFDLAAEIAATGYNASYFRRVFRAEFGRAPFDELRRIRLFYAQSLLLARNGCSTAGVGLSAGFRDPYYFSRVFKQFSGLTPTEFQRRHAFRSVG